MEGGSEGEGKMDEEGEDAAVRRGEREEGEREGGEKETGEKGNGTLASSGSSPLLRRLLRSSPSLALATRLHRQRPSIAQR